MKGLMLGNEAVARGLYEAGVTVVSSYPGTPSTEITEYACQYDEIYCEWAPNEKVACEAALGASIGGARAFCAMKHVGLNVAADPLFTASYTGVNAGLVIAVADDPGMHSSQNEQDSRHYAMAAKLPMLEPSDSSECKEYTKLAFELSERYDTPVLLRLSTRVSHSQSILQTSGRPTVTLKEYRKDPAKYVMMPGFARAKHVAVEERTLKLQEYAETASVNMMGIHDTSIGIITSGIAYQFAKEALGERTSYLKLGMVYPLPVRMIEEFASTVDTLYVVEELDDFIETHCKKLGLVVTGKELFPYMGEYSQLLVREKLLGETVNTKSFGENVPVRPPVMCPGCPHRGLFYSLNKLGVTVFGDIGCYTLGAAPPLNALDTTICMGASISGLHGFNKARGTESARTSVAVIGDSTFIHSGVTGLIDIAYNQGVSTVLILDNSITGMTGHQQNPTTGLTIKGDPTAKICLESLCKAVGIRRVRVVDPNQIKAAVSVIKEELAAEEPSVVIARRPCALLKSVKHGEPLFINREKCRACRACFKIGCPSIRLKEGKASIDQTLCVGCGLCASICSFDAITADE